MLKRGVFVFGAMLACAGCAARQPPPAAPTVQEALVNKVYLTLSDGRQLAIIQPDGWTAKLAINSASAENGLPKLGVVLENEELESFVLVAPLERTGKNATDEAKDLAALLTKDNDGTLTISRVFPLPDNPQATFHMKKGEARGIVTVRHVGDKEDVPVVFLGRWPNAKASEAYKTYWPTVFKTDVK